MDFSCEVAEAKAMSDTEWDIEDMVGTGNKGEEVLSSRLGMGVAC